MASLMADDTARYLPGDVLTKVDVCSMASSLEVRNPFLDPGVSLFARVLPISYKIQDGRRKRQQSAFDSGNLFSSISIPICPAFVKNNP